MNMQLVSCLVLGTALLLASQAAVGDDGLQIISVSSPRFMDLYSINTDSRENMAGAMRF